MNHFSKRILAGFVFLVASQVASLAQLSGQGMQLGNQQVYSVPSDIATAPTAGMTRIDSSFQGVVLLASGSAVTAARSVGFVITSAATVTFTLVDGSTIALALPVSAQLQTLPFAVTKYVLTAGAGTFWNLK